MKRQKFIISFGVLFLLAISILLFCGYPQSKKSAGDTTTTEEHSLRVLLDIDYKSDIRSSALRDMGDIRQQIADLCPEVSIQYESAPADGEERDSYLTRIRTELMAGNGPDVFVCMSGYRPSKTPGEFIQPLFSFPEQIMKRKIFLPLDKYIEKAQFMEWNRLPPVVMDAGKNEHGQMLLPMTYTMPVTIYKKSDYSDNISDIMTWNDARTDSTELQAAASSCTSMLMANVFSILADYEKEVLGFTEQELYQYINIKVDYLEHEFSGGTDRNYFINSICPDITYKTESGIIKFKQSDDLTFIPLYTMQGGYVATITSFGAINANTRYADAAFRVLDVLLSKESQSSLFYLHLLRHQSIPTYRFDDAELRKILQTSEHNTASIIDLCDNITKARVESRLEKEIYAILDKYFQSDSEKSLEDIVHQVYTSMSMMVGES